MIAGLALALGLGVVGVAGFLLVTLLRVVGVLAIQWRDLVSFDRWTEVLSTVRRNKLRTALTMISVAWGIFVLVFLLGLGHGLDNGLRSAFKHEAVNGITITAAKTSVPHNGYDVGRKITFENRDYDRAAAVKLPGVGAQQIDHISGQYFIRGGQFGGGEMLTKRNGKANAFQINAVHPDAIYIQSHTITAGRFLDPLDITQRRKSAVIGRAVEDFLFADDPVGADGPRRAAASDAPGAGSAAGSGAPAARGAVPGSSIGEWINVAGVPFQVVGVFSDDGGAEQERQIFIPVSTAQLAFNGSDRLGLIEFTVGSASADEAKAITDKVVAQLAERHQFDPADPQAVRVHNNVEQYERFSKLFWMISTFVVVIGLGTLAAGVVGVSNIMMIAVKERTKEIGVRKALGATPTSIVAMVIQEAIFLTGIAGLLGLSAGVAALGITPSVVESDFVKNPSINLGVGIAATIGLVVAGALAGFFPARAAARVNPITALRDQ